MSVSKRTPPSLVIHQNILLSIFDGHKQYCSDFLVKSIVFINILKI